MTRISVWLRRENEENVTRTRNCCGWPRCRCFACRKFLNTIAFCGEKLLVDRVNDAVHRVSNYADLLEYLTTPYMLAKICQLSHLKGVSTSFK